MSDDSPRNTLAAIAGEVLDDMGASADATALRAAAVAAAQRAFRRELDTVAAGLLEDALEGQAGEQVQAAARRAVDDVLAGGGEDAGVELCYPNCAAWLEGFLLPNYRRDPGTYRWCRTWWEHAEAISRIEALWQAWEAMRHDGATGMAVWWVNYADPILRTLTAPDGPFFACGRGHTVPEKLPAQETPEGLFRDADHPEESPA